MWKVVYLVFNALSVEFIFAQKSKEWAIVGNPVAFYAPCDDNKGVSVIFEAGQPPGEENKYILRIEEDFIPHSKVLLEFDSDATVSLGYLDNLIQGYQDTAEISTEIPDQSCGRRKIQHTELIVNGHPTKPGDWPWHVAIYRLRKSRIDYICGGTLLSKIFVMTAAHCVALRGVVVLPETRNVVLGKYNLVGGDISPQEREVHDIIIHENFNHTRLDNDIALLKLKSEVVYNDYIQPACVWYGNAYKRLPPGTIFGTVVGWGFDQTDDLSPTLQQVKIPKLSDTTCYKSNPNFYFRLLTDSKFCAGYNNGTSACNGDSGGGFHVFVPDEASDDSANATGAWNVRGIVSLTVAQRDVSICDTSQYVVFTDVAKFTGWLKKHMK